MTFTVRHFVGLNNTPALPLAVEGWNKLVAARHAAPLVQLYDRQNAFVAFDHLEFPVGVLVYCHFPDAKTIDVGIGYVRRPYRRHGVYRRLWDQLVAQAQALECATIDGNVAVTNKAMRACAASLGRREVAILLKFDVPPIGDA